MLMVISVGRIKILLSDCVQHCQVHGHKPEQLSVMNHTFVLHFLQTSATRWSHLHSPYINQFRLAAKLITVEQKSVERLAESLQMLSSPIPHLR